jgi:catechol-2,3-dioxygenase
MAGRIAEKSLRHVSLCVSDLAKAKAFWDSRSCRARTTASPVPG